jgi:hypothetical protein
MTTLLCCLDNDYNSIISFCIECEKIVCSENIIWDDYCNNPMLWCNSCGARIFFNKKTFYSNTKIINNNIILTNSQIQQIKNEINTWGEIPNIDSILSNFKVVELLIVKKVVNDKLAKCYYKKNKSQKSINKNYNNSSDLDSDNSSDSDNSNVSDIFNHNSLWKCEKFFNIGFECNSYNVNNPLIPYPDDFDISHDGKYIYCQCIDKNNKIIYCCYWGD